MSEQDTEITLGTGKLLGLFFALAAVCGLFFGLGFLLGKSSTPNNNASLVQEGVPVASGNAAKPSSARGEGKPQQGDCPQGQNCTPTPEMSFYKSDEPAAAKETKETAGPLVQSSAPAPAPEVKTAGETKAAVAPEITKPLIPGTGYLVQIAAVSKQQDAEALVGALRKKQYPVFISNPPGDALFHVQIGPFADMKEAEAMRTKLQGDGYNPILKK
jgi:cell division septation protein DedD